MFPGKEGRLYYIVFLNWMNDYGGSSSRGRPILKSPNPHLDDQKTLKKKYDALRDQLKAEKKNS